MANGPQSVDVTCRTGMRDSSSGGAGRVASDRAGRGVAAAASAAAASAGPDANPTTAQGDLPVPGDPLRGKPRFAAVDCQPEGSVDVQTRLCDDRTQEHEDITRSLCPATLTLTYESTSIVYVLLLHEIVLI